MLLLVQSKALDEALYKLSGAVTKLAASPSEVWLSPTSSINLGFTTEGRLAPVLIIPSSWGFQWGVIYTPSASAGSAPCQKSASINLQKLFVSPTGRLNLVS
jgi:hypothetical protein